MRLSAPAVFALSVACASEPPPVDPGETLGLGGAAGSGSSWWSEQVGEGRCANLVPRDGWSAGLDPDLLDAGDPYADIDAGLTQVVDALAGEQAFDAVAADLWIDGAVISNVGSSADAELWFADGLTVIPTVDLTSGVAGARPGDRVRFHVNAVKKDYGTDKIAGIDSFEILERDQPIQVVQEDLDTVIANFRDYLHYNIYVVGEVVQYERACGGSASCYSLAGADDGAASTMTLRVSNSVPMAAGACVELIAPLGEFSDSPQFNIAAPGGDSRWIRRFL